MTLFYHSSRSPQFPLWDSQRFYFFSLRTHENQRDPAQQLWPWLVFALEDMFIQIDINSLCFWLFAFYFFALPFTTSPSAPSKENSYFFIQWYNYFF